MPAVIIVAMHRPVYIQRSLGSFAVGESAVARAAPKAFVSRNMDMTKDFMEGGALVKAYSRPVMLAKISERPMKRYACGFER